MPSGLPHHLDKIGTISAEMSKPVVSVSRKMTADRSESTPRAHRIALSLQPSASSRIRRAGVLGGT